MASALLVSSDVEERGHEAGNYSEVRILPGCSTIHEKAFESHPSGFIGLQVHGVGNAGPFTVAWRNLKIRESK